ncbi:hypothetical protein BC938DRAFT_477006, partial [Jimgerdemannia flammicorona]
MSAEIAQIVGPNNQFQSLVVAGVSLAMYVVATVVFVSRILRHKGYTTPLYLLVALTLVRISQFAVEIPAIQRVNGDRIYSKTLVTVANVLDAMGVGMLFMTTLLSLRSWVVKVRMGTIHPNASQGHNPKTSYFLLFCSLLTLLNGILSMVAVGLSVSNGFDAEFDYYTTLEAFINTSAYVVLGIYLLLTLGYLGTFGFIYSQYVLPKSDCRYFWLLLASGALLGLRMIYSFAAIFAAYCNGVLLHLFLATLPEVLLLVLLGGFSRTFAYIVTIVPRDLVQGGEPMTE